MQLRLHVLILGGTTEASELARALAADPRYLVVISLAGRTASPRHQPVAVRMGGFGGAAGLARYLADERIDAMIDATHPFATQITRNAAEAANQVGLPFLSVLRPPWTEQQGDDWTHVPDMEAACAALGATPRGVFLTVGRQDLAPFLRAPQHRYVIRSVDLPDDSLIPPDAQVIAARGPFPEDDERRLMQDHTVSVLVTKNAGGSASRAKLDAARTLQIPVLVVDRPDPPACNTVPTARHALQWLARLHSDSFGAKRGV